MLVALDSTNNDVLGFASFGEWRGAWPGYRYTVEHTVHVRHDVRGQGVGRALVEALVPRALALGKHVMIGGIDAANEASIRFHERLGFERVANFREVGRLARFGVYAALSGRTRHFPIIKTNAAMKAFAALHESAYGTKRTFRD